MKYERFFEIIEEGKKRWPDHPALCFFDAENRLQKISYAEFFDLVRARAEELKQEVFVTAGMYGNAGVRWVTDLFAAAIAGKRVVLLDPSRDTETVQALIDEYGIQKILPDGAGFRTASSSEPGYEGCLLLFTSGTTAANKAVILSQKALCYSAWNGQAMLPCGEEDVIAAMLPLHHVFGLVCTLIWPLSGGAAVGLGRGMRFYGEDAGAYGTTILVSVPTLLQYLSAVNGIPESVHTVLVGAAPCSEKVLNAMKACGLRVSFGYGLSETASGLAISVGAEDPFAMDLCPDTKITIAQDREILVQTPCMMEGYWKRPEETARVLENGVLHTGDLGCLDAEGRLHLFGRKNDVLVLSNGEKIFCPEWEEILSKELGSEIALFVGDGKLTLLAGDGADLSFVQKITDAFNAKQPISRRIMKVMTIRGKLPRTAAGKIRRWKLEDINHE